MHAASASPISEASRYLPCSRAQEGLWLLEQATDIGSGNNLPLALELTGELDEVALRQAVVDLVDRHPALRTGFAERDGRLVRIERTLAEWGGYELDVVNFDGDLADGVAEVSRSLLDPLAWPPFTTTLIRAGRKRNVLVFVFHHVIFDGVSKDIVVNDLGVLYSLRVLRSAERLPPVPGTYSDYVAAEQGRITELSAKALAYWEPVIRFAQAAARLFGGANETSHDRVQQGDANNLVIDAGLKTGLEAVARSEGVSLYVLLLAAAQVMQYRYTGSADGGVTTAIAMGTRPRDMQGAVGMFVNEAPLHTSPMPRLPFSEFLVDVRDRVRELLEFRLFPYTEVAARVDGARAATPDVSVGYRKAQPLQSWPMGLAVETMRLLPNYGKRWPLAFQLLDEPAGVRGRLDFDPDLVPDILAKRMSTHFHNLLVAISQDPSQSLSALPLLSGSERRQLLVDWSSAGMERKPHEITIQRLVEEQVDRMPTAIAVTYGDESITYADLNIRANRLAHFLIRQGVGRETLVGIYLKPSIDVVIAVLAILKAGGAYLPLDPSYPNERLAFMLEDAEVPTVVSLSSLADELPVVGARVVRLDRDEAAIANESDRNPNVPADPDGLAFVLYTSGSTGVPKGVLGVQRTIVSRVTGEYIPFEATERLCQKTSLNFIDSIWEVFAALVRGLSTVMAPASAREDPRELIDLLDSADVTRLVLVPSLLRAILDLPDDLASRLPRLRYWISSGEPLVPEVCDRFSERLPGAVLINLYGTSECWDATWYDCGERRRGDTARVPIGCPLSCSRVYVLDSDGQPLPAGVPGELYVGGPGVARGYLNRPQLTADRFVRNVLPEDCEHLYRTGDLARHRPDGSLELLGRIDRQLKVRGHRIEPGEIEAALRVHADIRDAAVVPTEARHDQSLIAYLVSETADTPSPAQLRSRLRSQLPDWMVPSTFVYVDALPLTPSGKIDRTRLPAPAVARQSQSPRVAPRTGTERALAKIWADVLDLEYVSSEDDFFELGGHSLSAAQVVARAGEAFRLDLSLSALFNHPSVDGLAREIERMLVGAVAGSQQEVAIPRADRRPLSDLLDQR